MVVPNYPEIPAVHLSTAIVAQKLNGLEFDVFRKKVKGAWLGKAVGGTLGMPYEGREGPLSLTYYDPVPTHMLPNDDVDLQVLWAYVLNEMSEPCIDRDVFAQAWLNYTRYPCGEYGVALRNLKLNLRPPVTGYWDNWFINGMGAAIRSEIWACLAPGDPATAAAYAYEDACVDHAGDGLEAELFLSALESLAFVSSDKDYLLTTALSYISEHGLLHTCINDTRAWCAQSSDWLAIRNRIIEKYGHEEFTQCHQNIAFVIVGWLLGNDDFGKSICIAVNCGKDTDCTGATLGALMAIINPDSIEPHWLKPIDESLVISPEIVGINPPKSLDAFTDLIISLLPRVTLGSIAEHKSYGEVPSEFGCIPVRVGFGKYEEVFWEHADIQSGPALHEMKNTTLPGTFARWEASDFEADVLFIEYTIQMHKHQTVRVFFNSPQNVRVWIDGQYCFGRESGRMAPSAHYVPINQYIDLELAQGTHQVVAAIEKPKTGVAEWVFGVADAATKLWLGDSIWFDAGDRVKN